MQFEVRDNTIHVLNYPDADMILGLPDSQYVKRLKDMWLHWWDLNEAKQSLESMNSNNSDVVNRALAQNSIVVFYKCFGKSEFRDNSLKRNKILANFPPEAKKIVDYFIKLKEFLYFCAKWEVGSRKNFCLEHDGASTARLPGWRKICGVSL